MFVASKSKSHKLSQTISKQGKKFSYTQQNKLVQRISFKTRTAEKKAHEELTITSTPHARYL